MKKTHWVPEIYYEESDDGLTSHIPFISVPDDEEMPKMLFVFESRQTGSFEPDDEGEERPIVEIDLHQYADLIHLKKALTAEAYDDVRKALGLMPLAEATEAGKKISANLSTR